MLRDSEHIPLCRLRFGGSDLWCGAQPSGAKLRDPAALPGWLATNTHRECLRAVKAARKPGQLGIKLDEALRVADDTAVGEEILIAERSAVLLAAFAELPPRCQQLLSMMLADPPCS